MNKSAIRNFAVSARQKLIADVEQKAYQLGITKDEIREPEIYQDGFRINQQFYKKYEIDQRDKLLKQIKEKGYEHVIEEVAYTWFNRFIAIRFMEVNDYLPTGVRMFSSIMEGKTEPDAVTEVDMIALELGLDMDIVYRLQDANDTEDLFKYILVKQCNKLGEIMPVVFEQIADYTELLLPDQLLTDGSVVRDMVEMIDESDWKEEVEIIGWLYQYYISEKKDEVFAGLRKRKKITKENIPAATQLFTPKWIVEYMVENSLGRLWLESHPNDQLQANWQYYIEEAEQELEVQAELDKLKNPNIKPEDITVLDPAVGSGHILVYAFDVLHEIYESVGYAKRDIPKLILENNLYGLDIDDRAAQLAYFALMMKACSYNRRILDEPVKLQVCSIQQSNNLTNEMLESILQQSQFEGDKEKLQQVIENVIEVFYDAKEYGSILNVEENEYGLVREWLNQLQYEHFNNLFAEQDKELILEQLPALIHQAKIMSKKYDVVVTNPPYMGRGGMNPKLTKYLDKHYKDSKADLFAVFMEVCIQLAKEGKFASLINQHSWMFLSSYEKLRKKLLNQTLIQSMLHLGPRAFEEIGGEVVQSTTFVLRNIYNMQGFIGKYIRVVEDRTADKKKEKVFKAINKAKISYLYTFDQSKFDSIPSSPIAYWASRKIQKVFSENKKLGDIANPRQGLATGNNDYFIREWHEVNYQKINFNSQSLKEARTSGYKWFPMNKGGTFQKWYGNNESILAFDDKNYNHLLESGNKLPSRELYFKEGITWSKVSSSSFSVRYSKPGFIFSDAGMKLFVDKNMIGYICSFLNSKLVNKFLGYLSETMNYEKGNIERLPINTDVDKNTKQKIQESFIQNVTISTKDWDSFETSWDFESHPFLTGEPTIKSAYEKWEREAEERFQTLKANEEELNRIFINLYGLQDELTPDVEDKDVTVRKADLERDVKSFISYAVGCMLGRYSLDEDGLIFAGGEFDYSKYTTFPADKDNVIPITDEDYFDDDIVGRFIEFVRTVYSEESIEDNLDFIAEALTKRDNETSRQRIRRYFLNEFYDDHVRIYQKRPIYWQFDSGRQNGFKALIYMHRYESALFARVRIEYLHLLQRKYESEMKRMDIILESDVSQAEKRKATKQKEKLQKQLLECREYDQVIAHIANQKIEIDLDDGVKVNYAKFQNIEVPQGEGKAPLKANLLKKI